MQWAPVVTKDENFPQQPIEAFLSGEIVKVPIISGSNKDDGLMFGYGGK